MNFQGKIFYAGLPFSGSATMTFVLPDFLWTDNESVTVNNGFYSCVVGAANPMPIRLFDSLHHSRQMIVMFNTNPIDTVTLFAPFERDPSVPGYIRDSITWNDIHNKPTVDTSFTNEIQYLSIHGDTLRIDSTGHGNWVIIPGLSDTTGTRVVNGNFTVIDTVVSSMLTVPTGGSWTTIPTTPLTGVWQSFQATANGKLRHINVNVSSTLPTVFFYFYNGQGSGTPAIYGPVSMPCPTSFGTAVFDVSAFNLVVSSGSTYTFCFVPATGGQIVAQIQGNVYGGGIEGTFAPSTSSTTLNPGNDLAFSLDIDNSNPSCLTFGNNCYVGIGTNNPTAQLEVRGRVKDQTGFLMPVGTVISYAGRNIPQGWLFCDGSAVSRIAYADLFNAIDSSWGSGDHTSTFNLPDLRGTFLRGVDSSASNDPDHSSRTAGGGTFGGNTGNKVGSMQSDAFRSHSHAEKIIYGADLNFNATQYPPAALFGAGYLETGNQSGSTGGNETRPANAYVYYIIKY